MARCCADVRGGVRRRYDMRVDGLPYTTARYFAELVGHLARCFGNA